MRRKLSIAHDTQLRLTPPETENKDKRKAFKIHNAAPVRCSKDAETHSTGLALIVGGNRTSVCIFGSTVAIVLDVHRGRSPIEGKSRSFSISRQVRKEQVAQLLLSFLLEVHSCAESEAEEERFC